MVGFFGAGARGIARVYKRVGGARRPRLKDRGARIAIQTPHFRSNALEGFQNSEFFSNSN